jgi:hypothetical protein
MMLRGDDAERLLSLALREFAPDWDILGPVTEMTIRDPEHWLSGVGTYGTTLRNRRTGAVKVLGRHGDDGDSASYHRGVSRLVLEAYGDRNTDPIWRYLQEICVAECQPGARRMALRLGAR